MNHQTAQACRQHPLCPWCNEPLTFEPEDRGDRHHPPEIAGWLCDGCGRFWRDGPTDADHEAAALEREIEAAEEADNDDTTDLAVRRGDRDRVRALAFD